MLKKIKMNIPLKTMSTFNKTFSTHSIKQEGDKKV
jgi:hypothetical protein